MEAELRTEQRAAPELCLEVAQGPLSPALASLSSTRGDHKVQEKDRNAQK